MEQASGLGWVMGSDSWLEVLRDSIILSKGVEILEEKYGRMVNQIGVWLGGGSCFKILI